MTKEDKRKVLAELDELARGTSGVVRGTIEDCRCAVGEMPEEDVWIPVVERLPENETDVLIAYTRKGIRGYSYSGVCTAFHTDGHTSTENSSYNWEIDMYYNEGVDAYIVPEGWWETVDFGEEFSAVDAVVTHWMPLPEPPKEEEK